MLHSKAKPGELEEGQLQAPATSEPGSEAIVQDFAGPAGRSGNHLVQGVKPRTWVRSIFALALVAFSMLHAKPGMVAASVMKPGWAIWLYTGLWLLVVCELGTAGLGLMGFRMFANRWRELAILGAMASAALILSSAQWTLWPVVVIDAVITAVAFASRRREALMHERRWPARLLIFCAKGITITSLVYASAAILTRPVHNRWGATDAEIAKVLPGDEKSLSRDNFINHVATVGAPAEQVWPWMIELGQDKAGFFSYDWLERAIGDDVHNRFEIRPEWQHLKQGDLVRATQPGYLWGWVGTDIGWRVLKLEPGKLMQLDKWGTFWVEPLDGGRSRFGVRSHVGDVPFWAAPIEVFVFEPAHFIMEEKMIRTIKELAESRARK